MGPRINTLRAFPIFVALVASGCPLPLVIGQNPEDDPDSGTGTGSTGGTTGEPTSSGTGAEPGVCGDGVVGAGEACDDGNAEPHDGCDAACGRTGVLEWTVADPGATAVTVDKAGRIVAVAGNRVFALDPGGELLWETTVGNGGGFIDVAVDDAGRIYVADRLTAVHCLLFGGEEVWTFSEAPAPGVGEEIAGLALEGSGLYAVGAEENHETHLYRTILRRLDLDTGAMMWKSMTPADTDMLGQAVALSNDNIVAVGMGSPGGEGAKVLHAAVAVFDETGALVSFELGEQGRAWYAVTPIGAGGDLLLAGFGPTGDIVVRRVGPDLAEVWTHFKEESIGQGAQGIAAGPGETFVVVGNARTTNNNALVQRHAGDGAIVWTSIFQNPEFEYTLDGADDVAFGPDFVVVAGYETVSHEDYTITKSWIRKFAIE